LPPPFSLLTIIKVRGGTLCNVYERALETDEVARLIGKYILLLRLEIEYGS
jgi:hypothetical protein